VTPPARVTYEYRTDNVLGWTQPQIDELLNRRGGEGWAVTGFLPASPSGGGFGGGSLLVVFMRPRR
jgi:hypothetical protein